MNNTVLVVDDDQDVLNLVSQSLQNAGFFVLTAESGEETLVKARHAIPDLIILDIMLPGMSGLEVCSRLKRDSATSGIDIMMLTARHEEVDRVVGLELGADDYVTKPFSPREVVLRVKAILKRRTGPIKNENVLTIGPLELDHELLRVRVDGLYIDLTATEFKLLAILAERPWRAHSREKLLSDIWGYKTSTETRTVDAHMRRLRMKLASAADLILTIRGVGYRMAPERFESEQSN